MARFSRFMRQANDFVFKAEEARDFLGGAKNWRKMMLGPMLLSRISCCWPSLTHIPKKVVRVQQCFFTFQTISPIGLSNFLKGAVMKTRSWLDYIAIIVLF